MKAAAVEPKKNKTRLSQLDQLKKFVASKIDK
jgi:hypothetical protein